MIRPIPFFSALAMAALLTPQTAAAVTRALVIGIDDYAEIPPLAGAVNDARDIAETLERLGAETVVLLDGAASREAILSAWRALAARSGPGDRLIVTYAGHGSNEVESIPGEEPDGRDENWLLSGFSPFGPASGERIRDNEIAALIALSPDAEIILISDSCHSGTVARDIIPVLGYRFYRTDGALADDPLPPPPPPPATGPEFGGLALYMGAVPDTDKVPEFLIDGMPRGALSYSLAAGLDGAADADGDGAVTAGEIEEFVRSQIRRISNGLQRPQIIAASQSEDLSFRIGGETAVPIPDQGPVATIASDSLIAPEWPTGAADVILPGSDTAPETTAALLPQAGPDDLPATVDSSSPPPTDGSEDISDVATEAEALVPLHGFDALPPVTLAVQGDAPLAPPSGAQMVAAGSPASLVYDPATGLIRTMVGDILTDAGRPGAPGAAQALQTAVDNARLIAALASTDAAGRLDIRFAEGDGTYTEGEIVTVGIAGRQSDQLALFSIAPDGAISALYPITDTGAGIADPARIIATDPLNLALQVGPPFGADFLIAIETSGPDATIAALLADPAASLTAQDIWAAVESAAPLAVAVFPFHSKAG